MKKRYDYMDGHEFEAYCAKLLKRNGFHCVEVTRGSGDQGIDILANRKGKKYGIQCKCYSYYLGNKAIQEAYAGMKFYECDVAAVLTNQYFTNSAIALAEKTEVLLWNRSVLNELRRCRKSIFSTLLGFLCALTGGWLLYFLYSSASLSGLTSYPVVFEALTCLMLTLGGILFFLEKGSLFLVFLAFLLLGASCIFSLFSIASFGGLALFPWALFLFSLLRIRKLRNRSFP